MEKYKQHKEEQKKYLSLILDSDSRKKIVIAGPGTGKSSLFEEICKKNLKNGKRNNLVLSFINELVDDLKKDLYNIAEVKTLHSFALSNIEEDNKLFISLVDIIEEDYEIINNQEIDFAATFNNLIERKDCLEFYSERRRYYSFFSPNCSIYYLIKKFEENKEKIPKYSQILIDEFQDFNKLETKLIDLLAEKNPILIVGDDDQSLYSFKHANPSEIRVRSKDQNYSFFELPFCFRCPEVIINSFNNVVKKAKEQGLLKDRLDKQYKYFSSEEKDKISNKNPKILVKKKVYQTKIAYNIEQEIKKFFDPEDKEISLLIVCSLKNQIDTLKEMLIERGFKNIKIQQKNEKQQLIDAFNLLLKNKDCNLGWRIVSKHILSKENFDDIIKQSHVKEKKISFKELVGEDFRKNIESILTIIRKIEQNKNIKIWECKKVFDCLGYNAKEIFREKLKDDLKMDFRKNIFGGIPIKITTILGAKGLTSDYVFLVNFDDKYILDKSKITDENLCKFLVALTRAKKRTYIYTSENKLPTFVKWINEDNYEEI